MLTIQDVRVILTAPANSNLVVVKVQTSEPELYGLGCATFTQRYLPVASTVEEYLKPLLVGRDPRRISELWQLMMVNSYWRNGPVLNNAISGVDMALWDIKGKLASLPVYELLGGKCREAAAIYRHASGADPQKLGDHVAQWLDEGVRHVRVQTSGYGGAQYTGERPQGALEGVYNDQAGYMREFLAAIETLRDRFGEEVELLHDVHERLSPTRAVQFAKDLEPMGLFFLEDLFPPEQLDWLANVRAVCATPLALGELFVHPREWTPLIERRQIDFIRMHLSAMGGLTPAHKAAILAEAHDIRTAWHGPKDVSPVGHAANLHLDLASPNFGIQETAGFTDAEREIFPGCPEIRRGYLYLNDRPGLGIDIDEKAAARFPCQPKVVRWTQVRQPDGSLMRP